MGSANFDVKPPFPVGLGIWPFLNGIVKDFPEIITLLQAYHIQLTKSDNSLLQGYISSVYLYLRYKVKRIIDNRFTITLQQRYNSHRAKGRAAR